MILIIEVERRVWVGTDNLDYGVIEGRGGGENTNGTIDNGLLSR